MSIPDPPPGKQPSATRIGFIGLGIMGLPMAKRLGAAGYPLFVHTRTPERITLLTPATALPSPAEVARASDVVITMLPDSSDVLDVIDGPNGLLVGARKGLIWIDMSSIAPAVARDAASRATGLGLSCLDAPVSGGEKGAIEGTLSIMVGGPDQVFGEALPILRCLGSSVVHLGECGSGQVTKLCNQMLVASNIAAVAEALVLADKAGVDPERAREALLGGFAASTVLEVHGARMIERNFEPGFRTDLHRKDLSNALATGRSLNCPLTLTATVAQLMAAQAASGDQDLDHSALVMVYEQLAAHVLRRQ